MLEKFFLPPFLCPEKIFAPPPPTPRQQFLEKK
jgi:hypothetical protein